MSMDLAEAVTAYTAGVNALLAADVDTPSHRELVVRFADIETQTRRVPAIGYAILGRLDREADPKELGGTSLWTVLARRCRLTKGDIQRRIRWAKQLGPRRTMQGLELAPVWEHTATAIADGAIGDDHVTVIARTMKLLARHVDDTTCAQAEHSLADVARDLSPAQLAVAAAHLLALLHPDGELSDEEAARKIGLTLGPQQPDGTSYLKGWISPKLRALLEPVIATFAHRDRRKKKPDADAGAGNPFDDPAYNPFADDTPLPEDDWPTLFDEPTDDEQIDTDPEAVPEAESESEPESEPAPESEPEPDAGAGDRDTVEPTEPAEPADEIDSSEPADATEPSEPADATEPSEPADATEPSDPADPADTVADSDAEMPFPPAGPDDPAPPPPEPRYDHRWRTKAQYTHDALAAGLDMLLRSNTLGTLNGLPTTMVITTTLRELMTGAGYAVTGGGTRIPIPHLIELAGQGAYHYLEVFDDHTGEILHFGRAKRCATGAQKLALFGRDRGCTAPGCDVPFYDTQAHHAVADWKRDGQTDVNDLTLACKPENLMLDLTDWATRIRRTDHRTEWIPPPHLDHGQPRTNNTHHPDRLLHPREDHPPDDSQGDDP